MRLITMYPLVNNECKIFIITLNHRSLNVHINSIKNNNIIKLLMG